MRLEHRSAKYASGETSNYALFTEHTDGKGNGEGGDLHTIRFSDNDGGDGFGHGPGGAGHNREDGSGAGRLHRDPTRRQHDELLLLYATH